MSLKTFHLIFILIAMMMADLFGGWAVHEYHTMDDRAALFMGIGAFAVGLGLAAYSIWFVKKAREAHLE